MYLTNKINVKHVFKNIYLFVASLFELPSFLCLFFSSYFAFCWALSCEDGGAPRDPLLVWKAGESKLLGRQVSRLRISPQVLLIKGVIGSETMAPPLLSSPILSSLVHYCYILATFIAQLWPNNSKKWVGLEPTKLSGSKKHLCTTFPVFCRVAVRGPT